MNTKKILSIRKYADLVGCTEGNVRDAIRTGKIVNGVIKQGGKNKGIDVEVANAEWGNNFNTERPRNMALVENLVKPAGKAIVKQKPVAEDTEGNLETLLAEVSDIEVYDNDTLPEASRKKVILEARQLKLKVAELQGRLVDKEKVYKALFAAGVEVRNALYNVPSRTIDEILSAPTRIDAQRILTEAINDALKSVSDLNKRIDKNEETITNT